MSEIEELERRKKELELRRDIARLERNERIANEASRIANEAKGITSEVSKNVVAHGARTASWSWKWVAPLTLFGLYLILGGVVDGPIIVAGLGLLCLVPILAKFSGRR